MQSDLGYVASIPSLHTYWSVKKKLHFFLLIHIVLEQRECVFFQLGYVFLADDYFSCERCMCNV